jgi:hypothetical protein
MVTELVHTSRRHAGSLYRPPPEKVEVGSVDEPAVTPREDLSIFWRVHA